MPQTTNSDDGGAEASSDATPATATARSNEPAAIAAVRSSDNEDEGDTFDTSGSENDEVGERQERFNSNGRLLFGVNQVWEKAHGAHQVFVSVKVTALRDISTAQQTFTSRFTVTQQWMMSRADQKRLEAAGWTAGDNVPGDFEPEWAPPQLSFPMLKESKGSDDVGALRLREVDCMVVYEQDTLVHAIFGEELELHSFPFDCQDLSIEIIWDIAATTCSIWPSQSEPHFVELEVSKMPISEWRIRPPIVEFKHQPVKVIGKDMRATTEKRPVLHLRLKVERVWSAYVNQILVVLALITGSTLAAFVLPAHDMGNRLGHVTTMFLTAIAFQFVVSTMLPKLHCEYYYM